VRGLRRRGRAIAACARRHRGVCRTRRRVRAAAAAAGRAGAAGPGVRSAESRTAGVRRPDAGVPQTGSAGRGKDTGKASPTPEAEAAVRARQQELAQALRTKVRPNARQGDIFTPDVASVLRRRIETLFNGPQRNLLLDDLAEQNTTPAKTPAP